MIHHTPACLLGTATDLVSTTAEQLCHLVDALDGGVSEDVLDKVCQVLAVIELAEDSLDQLTENEHDANPEDRCHESEEQAAPGERTN